MDAPVPRGNAASSTPAKITRTRQHEVLAGLINEYHAARAARTGFRTLRDFVWAIDKEQGALRRVHVGERRPLGDTGRSVDLDRQVDDLAYPLRYHRFGD